MNPTGTNSTTSSGVTHLLPRPRIRWRVYFSSTRLYWICQLGGWGTLYLLQFLALLSMHLASPTQLAIGCLYEMSLFLIATHLFRTWIKRSGWNTLSTPMLFPRLVVSVLLMAAAVLGLAYFIGAVLRPYLSPPPSALRISLSMRLILGYTNSCIMLALWTACYFGSMFIRQSKQAEVRQLQLSQALQFAELRLLKSQLNPHFLFNSLNSVRALIAEDPERAQTAVTQLARTLRYTLSSSRDEVVSLEHELEIVKDYLEIEALRLAERLHVTWDIARDTYAARIPIMLLQTLVENAVKHGISQLPGGGELRVHARMQDQMLLIEVTNQRPAASAVRNPASNGIGLLNSAERLRLMFGPPAALQLALEDPSKARATVCVPQSKPFAPRV